jgi:hypothetical protein
VTDAPKSKGNGLPWQEVVPLFSVYVHCHMENQVERFFALITGRMIRRGTFHSTEELEKTIYHWLASWNGDPTPFVWKASASVILDKVRRCKELPKTGD